MWSAYRFGKAHDQTAVTIQIDRAIPLRIAQMNKEPTPQGHDRSELILLPSLAASPGANGKVVLTDKYLSGVAEYAKRWPGQVTSLVRLSTQATTDMDHAEITLGGEGVGVELRPEASGIGDRLKDAAVVHMFLAPDEAETLDLCNTLGVPVVFSSEYSPRTERQITDAEISNPIVRLRRKAWLWNAERTRRRMLPRAAGIQCSGTPTYDLYRHIQPNALLFFDNRVRNLDVIDASGQAEKTAGILEGNPLRLVFGGRMIAMKGVLDLLKVAQALKTMGVAFSMDIVGDGPLKSQLRDQTSRSGLQTHVRLHDPMDFATGWIPFLKTSADLFVCCHPQGDPSSTYPEVMSCGVPIAGYDNEAFAGIVDHSGGGFLSPMHAPKALARRIGELDRDRPRLAAVADKARTFALQHTFEVTFGRRIDHLIAASRLQAD